MISFDLKCGQAHVFEAWFRSSAAYDKQRAAAMIACPVCGDPNVVKAAMAPAVAAKGNQRKARSERAEEAPIALSNAPADMSHVKAMLSAIAQAQAKALEQSQWVGDDFGELARAMHYGEAEQASIHGNATAQEARAMIEEGLPVAPLIVPIAPPDEVQ